MRVSPPRSSYTQLKIDRNDIAGTAVRGEEEQEVMKFLYPLYVGEIFKVINIIKFI